jgi:2-polyprenyl-6-methoxyphenol hydroxylase-like FAD-dependent oxidoreductase
MAMTYAGKAAVLGGGIGGLVAANALVARGWHVDVFERAASAPSTGTALGLWPEAIRALELSGLGGRAEQLGVLQRSGALMRWDGKVLGRFGALRQSIRTPPILLSRPALLAMLASGLPSGTIRFGTAAPSLADLTGYDVTIGADGIGSAARDQIFGRSFRPVHSGYAAWRGWVPGATAEMSETWGPGALFGITPRDGDLTNWFAAVRTPAGGAGTVDELRARFGNWHPAVRDVLDRLDPATVLHHDLYESPRLPSYVRGRTALIGDAAHAMTPNLGRGACEAMVDGSTLAAALTEHPVTEALALYDRARRRRTRRLVRASRAVARVATSTHLTGFRDTVVGAAVRFA